MLRRVLSLFRRHVARELHAIGTEVRRISRPYPVRSPEYIARHDQLRDDVAHGRISPIDRQHAARCVGSSPEAA